MDILIVYATLEGQSAKIADHIAQTLRKRGLHVTTHAVERLPANFTMSDDCALIIGGPIHMGQYPRLMKKFIRQNLDWLNQHPAALFTVCMAINSQLPKSRQQAADYVEKLIHDTKWQPSLTAIFAGAVKYTQYGLITRYIMKRIAKHEGGKTDTSRDHEYTDWEAVTRFSEQFAAMLAG